MWVEGTESYPWVVTTPDKTGFFRMLKEFVIRAMEDHFESLCFRMDPQILFVHQSSESLHSRHHTVVNPDEKPAL